MTDLSNEELERLAIIAAEEINEAAIRYAARTAGKDQDGETAWSAHAILVWSVLLEAAASRTAKNIQDGLAGTLDPDTLKIDDQWQAKLRDAVALERLGEGGGR